MPELRPALPSALPALPLLRVFAGEACAASSAPPGLLAMAAASDATDDSLQRAETAEFLFEVVLFISGVALCTLGVVLLTFGVVLFIIAVVLFTFGEVLLTF